MLNNFCRKFLCFGDGKLYFKCFFCSHLFSYTSRFSIRLVLIDFSKIISFKLRVDFPILQKADSFITFLFELCLTWRSIKKENIKLFSIYVCLKP